MGSPESTWSTLLAALLLDADISRAFFPGQDEEKQNTDVEKKRAEMTIFIEHSQHPQCVKHCARGFLLIILNSPNNTKRVIL